MRSLSLLGPWLLLLESRLRITEIFFSIQGESTRVGLPTVFVRLTGCPLRCQYCDTAYAFKGGEWKTTSEILEAVQSYPTPYVTVTGGEPLAQKAVLPLMTELANIGCSISLETSGALPIHEVDPRVSRIVDLKTPGSAELSRNLYENIAYLKPTDEVKIVICDKADYEWAKDILNQYDLSSKCPVLFSPSHTELRPEELAEWIMSDGLPVRLQTQMHKYMWGNAQGR